MNERVSEIGGHLRGQLAKAVGVQHAGDCGREQVQRKPPQKAARARPWAQAQMQSQGMV